MSVPFQQAMSLYFDFNSFSVTSSDDMPRVITLHMAIIYPQESEDVYRKHVRAVRRPSSSVTMRNHVDGACGETRTANGPIGMI